MSTPSAVDLLAQCVLQSTPSKTDTFGIGSKCPS